MPKIVHGNQLMTLDRQLAALPNMATAELRHEWQQVWKAPPPQLGHDLLRRGIAWKLQERVHGKCPTSVMRELDRLAKQIERGGELSFDSPVKPGTRLVRQWRGRTYHVLVQDDGYQFDDRLYASLSQIACEITGTRWSGPRFFGLVKLQPEAANGES